MMFIIFVKNDKPPNLLVEKFQREKLETSKYKRVSVIMSGYVINVILPSPVITYFGLKYVSNFSKISKLAFLFGPY